MKRDSRVPAECCPSCNEYRAVTVQKRKETFPVRGEPIEIISDVLVCNVCGIEIYDDILDSANLERAYTIYRKRHGLLGPKSIKRLREEHRMSQREFADLLGWRLKTLRRYEAGAIIAPEHNKQLLNISPFDALAEQAIQEYKEGRTKNLNEV